MSGTSMRYTAEVTAAAKKPKIVTPREKPWNVPTQILVKRSVNLIRVRQRTALVFKQSLHQRKSKWKKTTRGASQLSCAHHWLNQNIPPLGNGISCCQTFWSCRDLLGFVTGGACPELSPSIQDPRKRSLLGRDPQWPRCMKICVPCCMWCH